jgi:hypothetical protein
VLTALYRAPPEAFPKRKDSGTNERAVTWRIGYRNGVRVDDGDWDWDGSQREGVGGCRGTLADVHEPGTSLVEVSTTAFGLFHGYFLAVGQRSFAHPQHHRRYTDISRTTQPPLAASHDTTEKPRVGVFSNLCGLLPRRHMFVCSTLAPEGFLGYALTASGGWLTLPWPGSLSRPWPLTSPDFNADHLQRPLTHSILLQFSSSFFLGLSQPFPSAEGCLDGSHHPRRGHTNLELACASRGRCREWLMEALDASIHIPPWRCYPGHGALKPTGRRRLWLQQCSVPAIPNVPHAHSVLGRAPSMRFRAGHRPRMPFLTGSFDAGAQTAEQRRWCRVSGQAQSRPRLGV